MAIKAQINESEMLRVDDLVIGYPGKKVAEQISFTASANEVVCLIGPNGGGKTTLLATMAAQLAPLAGSICVKGKGIDTYTPAEYARMVAYMSTVRPYGGQATCREMVESGRYPYTDRLGRLGSADREAVERALSDADATELAKLRYTELSDGQKQRILLAKTFCQETPILLLDEPTSYLDIRYKLEFLDIIERKVKKDGVTVIMSVHDVTPSCRIADRIIGIREQTAIPVTNKKGALPDEETLRKIYDIPVDIYEKWMKSGVNRQVELKVF